MYFFYDNISGITGLNKRLEGKQLSFGAGENRIELNFQVSRRCEWIINGNYVKLKEIQLKDIGLRIPVYFGNNSA